MMRLKMMLITTQIVIVITLNFQSSQPLNVDACVTGCCFFNLLLMFLHPISKWKGCLNIARKVSKKTNFKTYFVINFSLICQQFLLGQGRTRISSFAGDVINFLTLHRIESRILSFWLCWSLVHSNLVGSMWTSCSSLSLLMCWDTSEEV